MADRTNTQKLLTLHVSEELFEAAESCRRGKPRSQWLRDAILEKLQREGVEVPEEAAFAPDRSGKGGPKPKLVRPAAELKVAEDHGPLPPSASAPRKETKYPKKKGR